VSYKIRALLKAYSGQGLRHDLERLENDTVTALVDSLKKHGVSETIINEALTDVVQG